MMPWSQHVYSTMVSEVAYDEERREMIITWAKGKRSIYAGVPEELARQVANAPSVGQMINTEIKPYYQHRYTT